ncbi:MAG: hypothetical protein QM734_14160 [Cyclobacteriaceae bacterium]
MAVIIGNPYGYPIAQQKTKSSFFLNDSIGYVIAGGDANSTATIGNVLKTTDGGKTWTNPYGAAISFISDLDGLYFLTPQYGFVSSTDYYNPAVYNTADGGTTWNKLNVPDGFMKVQFMTNTIGYAINSNQQTPHFYKTTDGGSTWSLVFSPPFPIITFHFVDSNVGFLLNNQGYLNMTSDGGATWKP